MTDALEPEVAEEPYVLLAPLVEAEATETIEPVDASRDQQERRARRRRRRRVRVHHVGWSLILVMAASLAAAIVRALIGTPLGSDAYSYLVWAREAVDHGSTGHAAYDFTVPKPLEQLVAVIGHLVGAPIGVFTWWTMLGAASCVLAAGALARRVGVPSAGGIAGLFCLCLPVLWRGAPAGDSNVPYAALVVGAAAAPGGSVMRAVMIGGAGLLRPEAWGLAILNAILSWRKSDLLGRASAAVAALAPPVVWISLDRIFTGDALWSSKIVDSYGATFGTTLLKLDALPHAVVNRVGDVSTWPIAVIGVIALVAALYRKPLDVAVVFPLALSAVIVFECATDKISKDDLGRMMTALAVFAAAGAGAGVASLARHLRGSLAIAIVVLVPLLASSWLAQAARDSHADGQRARDLEDWIAPALVGQDFTGKVGILRQWQGALSLYTGLPRDRFVPEGLIEPRVDFLIARSEIDAFVLPHGKNRKRFFCVGLARATSWNLFVRGEPGQCR